MSGDSRYLQGTVLGDRLPDRDQVRRLVADRVRSTPGVARLEPSLQQSLSRIAGQASGLLTGRQRPEADGGVHVTLDGARAHIKIDLMITQDESIVRVGDDVRDGVWQLLREAGFETVKVDVTVLGLEG